MMVSQFTSCDARVKAATEEYVYYDKKLRQRSYKLDKYFIVLEDNGPFIKGDNVKIILEDDFHKLGKILKQLQADKKDLQKQVEDLQNIIQMKEEAGLKDKLMGIFL